MNPASNDLLRSGVNWALWRVLDHVAARFLPTILPGGMQPGASPPQAAQPDALPGLSAALAALREVDPAELQAALASLNDDSSPVVQCLAWALGAEGIDPAERQRRLEASLTVLSRAEAFALLAVLLHQAQAAGQQ